MIPPAIKYRTLRFVASVFEIVGVLSGAAALIAGGLMLMVSLIALRETQGATLGGALFAILYMIGGLIWAAFIFAIGQAIRLFIDIEHNQRRQLAKMDAILP